MFNAKQFDQWVKKRAAIKKKARGRGRPPSRRYGSWKDGSIIFKDSKGYFVWQWNPKYKREYRKYI